MGQVVQTGIVTEELGSNTTEVNHIDTYSVFELGSDHHIESEVEYIASELGVEPPDDLFDVEYDMKRFVDWLADASVFAIMHALPHEVVEREGLAPILRSTDPVIRNVERVGGTWSPREYNFTTDGYMARWTIDADALNRWLEENRIALPDGHGIPGFIRTADDEFWYIANAIREYLEREVFSTPDAYRHAIEDQMASDGVEIDMCHVYLTEAGAKYAIEHGADPEKVAQFTRPAVKEAKV
jgi:hypothetical protein